MQSNTDTRKKRRRKSVRSSSLPYKRYSGEKNLTTLEGISLLVTLMMTHLGVSEIGTSLKKKSTECVGGNENDSRSR